MNKDIRIDLSFLTHRKRKKLAQILGPQGPLSLIDLWLNTAQNRPKGILTGMSDADIALDAQWPGDPGEFCKALFDVGFLDRAEDETYSIHDWRDHQPWAYFAEERSKCARKAAKIRWAKRGGELKKNENFLAHPKKDQKLKKVGGKRKPQDADSIRTACDPHTEGNAPIPSPIPNPKPTPEKEIIKEKYGQFKNVLLTPIEREKVSDEEIENLSEYKASKGKTYKSDYATILNWRRRKRDGADRREDSRDYRECKSKGGKYAHLTTTVGDRGGEAGKET